MLMRWQNKIQGIFFNLENLSLDEIRDYSEEIVEDRKIWVKISIEGKIDEKIGIKNGKQLSPELKEYIERVNKILESSYKIHDALLAQRAIVVLKGIDPLEDALNQVNSSTDSIIGVEVFNAQIDLSDFSTAFNELETEYIRLKCDEDLASKLSQMF